MSDINDVHGKKRRFGSSRHYTAQGNRRHYYTGHRSDRHTHSQISAKDIYHREKWRKILLFSKRAAFCIVVLFVIGYIIWAILNPEAEMLGTASDRSKTEEVTTLRLRVNELEHEVESLKTELAQYKTQEAAQGIGGEAEYNAEEQPSGEETEQETEPDTAEDMQPTEEN